VQRQAPRHGAGGGKLFFLEDHPKLMSVLLQEFWRSIA
jgi:hypothetical protein